MNVRPELLLLTRDRELASRMSAAASAVARVESAESPEELEPRLSTLHSPAVFLDLRRPEHEEVLAYYLSHPRRPVVVAVAAGSSEPARRAVALGALAVLDPQAGGEQIERLVRLSISHAALLREVLDLRSRVNPARPEPVAAPVPASLFGLLRSRPNFDGVQEAMQSALDSLCASTGLARAGVFVREDSSGPFRPIASFSPVRGESRLTYSPVHPLPLLLENGGAAILRSRLEAIGNPDARRDVLAALDATGSEILFPLFARQGMLGWLYAGRFANGRPFLTEDLDSLTAAAAYLAQILAQATDRIRRDRHLEFARAVGEILPAGLVCIDGGGIVRFLNPEAGRLLLVQPADIVGGPVESIGGWLAGLLRDGLAGQGDRVIMEPRNPELRHLQIFIRQLPDSAGAVALLLDRSEEAALRSHRDQQDETAFWRDLASGMSHEIRNPLTAVRLFTQLLPERRLDPDFCEEASRQVGASVAKLVQILETIDQFANPPEPRFGPVALKAVVTHACKQANTVIAQPVIQIRLSDELEGAMIKADAPSMEESLAQLLINGLEAVSGVAEPHVEIAARAAALPGGRSAVMLSVKDNGRGIPADLLERVFSPFHTTKVRGMGLGLPHARRTIRAHQGSLILESGKHGTQIHVLVPLHAGS